MVDCLFLAPAPWITEQRRFEQRLPRGIAMSKYYFVWNTRCGEGGSWNNVVASWSFQPFECCKGVGKALRRMQEARHHCLDLLTMRLFPARGVMRMVILRCTEFKAPCGETSDLGPLCMTRSPGGVIVLLNNLSTWNAIVSK